MDVFSKSDPICAVFLKDQVNKTWREVGRTEIIWNNLNPKWEKKTTVDYYFEERQFLKFMVYVCLYFNVLVYRTEIDVPISMGSR